MSNNAPLNSLQDIEKKKRQLKAKIELQERKLSRDLDEYQEDVETLKNTWSRIKGIRSIGQNISSSGISHVLQALPIGGRAVTGGKSRWLTAFSLGAELVSWMIRRKKKKNKS